MMIHNFEWNFGTKIIFGAGTQKNVGKECKAYGNSALIVRDDGSFLEESGFLREIEASLEAEGICYTYLRGIRPNPVVEKVREGIALCREKEISFLLAVGGGSAMDTAKAIAAGVNYSGDVWDLFTGKGAVQNPLPLGVVVTIAATGSEGSIGSVITNPEANEKYDLLHPQLRPRFAVLNPEITLSLPKQQTACGVVDILSHAMERYFTNTPDTELTDRLGEAVMKTVVNNGLLLEENGQNSTARSQIMWASTLAHNGLLEGGRNSCWASHAIGTELSAHYNVTHGATLSVIIPAWMSYCCASDIARFARFANKVMDVEYDAQHPEVTAKRGIEALTLFYKKLGMPTTIRELGIDSQDRFEAMAKSATRFGEIGCIQKLNVQDVVHILELAF